MELNKLEKQQYNRHIILNEVGLEGQLKLKKAKVLVIGAGGLGCPVLQYLTAAGVGKIGILDDDAIEISNLQRQVLYSYWDVGRNKAIAAADRLQSHNPTVLFDVHNLRLTNENVLEIIDPYDIIIDCTDNFPTRYLINDASVIKNKPVVFGSIFKFEGQVSVFNYQNGPTYRCLYPTPPNPNESPNCSDIGVLGVLPGIIGSLQANEALKIILDLGDVLNGKLLKYDALSMQQMILSFKKDNSITINTLDSDYPGFCGFSDSVEEISIEEYYNNFQEYNLLDVRTTEERQISSIESIHIPIDELSQRIHEVPQDKELIIFCKSGIRSKKAIEILRKNGIKIKLSNLKNGLN
ncbi:HesA/MoeB/ThiF family protein [Marinigracilibium pacificum]|uniref:Molybdopterin-synthase adenylyltransferase n=1 Tax=Marinigracilibium pacificum TaxID=2729599 RepID=A0A848J3H9_9BACT|nr:HesA/MoeB/ThiF family protein [Marinigracilibium pacificum]NMM47732.1 molybdopterin-synthase adenylyltransferase MoeB [Marinigracilibium pacificum]